ncbi:ABC transporter substrate-binding protein [Paracidovorax konjaci]|uniref:ABC-type branched-chain amino acid transport system, substrate-binding protein n=1 Tax=Paracidovorax konjaci TaxID=32040 RepID=A0A1I1UTR5_9BURK|nr:ABC transporter substrate-binding protein [Paracidovorax konjaci]SFD71410.1 ABC-type branched-chain amino acid transport system, substrate-binding protein [Paracidovorax konjaci]
MTASRFLTLLLAAGLAATSASAQLLIGQTAGFSGPVAAGVQEVTKGAKLYLDEVNENGGVGGQKVELVSVDDRFDPKVSAENARKLIEETGVLAMFLTRGTPHTEAVLPLLDKHGVPLVGPSTGAMVLHQPVRRHVFNVRASYQREAERAMGHLAGIGMNRIALLTVDDSFGNDALQGALRGLKAARLEPAVQATFARDKPDFSHIAPAVAKENAQGVLIVGTALAVADGIAAIRAAGSKAQLVTLSNNATAGFIAGLGANAAGTIVTQVFPNERSVAVPMVKEAQALAKKRDVAGGLSGAMLEGYASAKVLVEGLRRAGPKPTRATLQASLEGLRKFDLGGLEVGYTPTDHSGLDFTDLSIVGADGRFRR